MDNEKTTGWLVIITFLAFAVATMFAFIELQEYQEPLPTDAKLFNSD